MDHGEAREVILRDGLLVTRLELSRVFLRCPSGEAYEAKYAVPIHWRWMDPEKRWLAAISDRYIEDVFEWSRELQAYVVSNLKLPEVQDRVEAMLVFWRMAKPAASRYVG